MIERISKERRAIDKQHLGEIQEWLIMDIKRIIKQGRMKRRDREREDRRLIDIWMKVDRRREQRMTNKTREIVKKHKDRREATIKGKENKRQREEKKQTRRRTEGQKRAASAKEVEPYIGYEEYQTGTDGSETESAIESEDEEEKEREDQKRKEKAEREKQDEKEEEKQESRRRRRERE